MQETTPRKPLELEGVLHFFYETGTEGGYWAFQDAQFIECEQDYLSCSRCYSILDKEFNEISTVYPLEVLIEMEMNGVIHENCPPGEHTWLYEGLYILKDEDTLVIYDKGDQTGMVWQGDIDLIYFSPFSETVFGMYIHSEQRGVDREEWARWFLEEYPAKLTTNRVAPPSVLSFSP